MTNASSAGRGGGFLRLAYLAAGVVWLTVSLLPRGATLIYLWPWPLVLTLALLVPPAALAWRLLAGEAIPRLGGLADWAVLVLLGAHVAAALLSPFRAASSALLLLPLAALCLPYELQAWRRSDTEAAGLAARALAGVLVLFTAVSLVLWVVFIASAKGLDELWLARNPHPLGHPNYTAGALLLLLPFGFARLVESRGPRRLAWCLAVAAALFCLFTAGSRAALLGLAAGGAAAGCLLVRSGRISRRRAFLLVGACAAGVAVFAVVNPRVRDLLRPTQGVPDDSTIQRAAMLSAGRRMIAGRPALGWGPGVTPLVYPRFRRDLSGGVDTALQLHDAPLQLAADTGLVGLAAMLLLLGAGAWSGWRQCDPAASIARLPGAAIAGIAVAAYGIFAVFDYELDVPLFLVAGAICLTLLFPQRDRAGSLPRWPAFAVLAAALAVALPPRVSQLRGHRLLARAADALENQDPGTFDALALRASEVDVHDTTALNALALQFGERAHRPADPGAQAQLTAEAARRFGESLARNPDQELCETNLGWLLLAHHPAQAAGHFLAAARLVPEKEGLGLGLAKANLAAGRRDAAIVALAVECLTDPRFLLSPLWRSGPLAELRPDVLAAVTARASFLAASPALAAWQRAELVYLGSVAAWLAGSTAPANVVPVALNGEQRAFFSSGHPPELLAQLAAAGPEDIVQFRSQRPGYGVLMRNLDAPMPVDFYQSPHYRAVIGPDAFLLPERLHLPGPLLLAEFARIPVLPP